MTTANPKTLRQAVIYFSNPEACLAEMIKFRWPVGVVKCPTCGSDKVSFIVHTNGLENYWSLLKRMLRGTYVSVEPFHLFRYLDEQAFRFNERKLTDFARFALTAKPVFG